MELSERKLKILASIIDVYVATGDPVGSKLIAEKIGVSSATIRNEMADLIEMGFLLQMFLKKLKQLIADGVYPAGF